MPAIDERLHLAGWTFRVRSEFRVDAVFREPAYRAFLSPGGGPPQAGEVEVVLREAEPAVPRGAVLLCETEAWSLHAEGGARHIAQGPRGTPAPRWAASFEPGGRTVAVDCHPDSVARGRGGEFWVPLRYPLDQLILVYALAAAGGALVHAAGVRVRGTAQFFAGTSGAGKTTWSRLAAGVADAQVLSDDRVVLRPQDGAWRLYGTPWPGEGGYAVAGGAPLVAGWILRKAADSRFAPLTPAGALDRLLPAVSVPWFDRPYTERALAALDAALAAVPVGEFGFRPDASAADAFAAQARRPS